jgi:hypothetical protein
MTKKESKHDKLRDQLRELVGTTPSFVVLRDDGSKVLYPSDSRLFLAERFARLLQADVDLV